MVASSMAAALEKAGYFSEAANHLLIACARYFNDAGATIVEFDRVMAKARHEMLSEGRSQSVQQDQFSIADAQPPMVEGGQFEDASDGHQMVASLHQPKPDEGHNTCAGNGQHKPADVRSPMPEGQYRGVREDQANHADGLPIASGEARGLVPERAMDCLRPARGSVSPIRDEGHIDGVPKDQKPLANVPNQIPREGHGGNVREGHLKVANAGNPIASGEANHVLPGKAAYTMPPAREPVSIRRPTPEQRAAALRAGHTSIASIFDRKLPDNTPVGDVWSDQLPRRIAENVREAAFLLRLKNYGIPPKPMKIRDYIPAEYVNKVWKESSMVDVTSVLGEGILLSPDGRLSFVKKSA